MPGLARNQDGSVTATQRIRQLVWENCGTGTTRPQEPIRKHAGQTIKKGPTTGLRPE